MESATHPTAVFVSLLTGLTLAAPAWAAYTLTDLGTLGGTYSSAYGINASSQVVGSAYTAGNQDLAPGHAFLWSTGAMIDLGTLGGWRSSALGINASGQVVGSANTAGNAAEHAFLWSNPGQMQDIGTLGGTNSYARGISASGQVVGSADTAGDQGTHHAFLWSTGGMTDLGTLGGKYSDARSINDSGQVVGAASTYTDPYSGPPYTFASHAFLWNNGAMTDLGTLGGTDSAAYGINASGQVVGWANTAGNASHAFLWSNGTMTDLGTLGGTGSFAWGINASGQVVGWAGTADNAAHPVLWSNGTIIDLNSVVDPALGWALTEARAINDVGQIVGIGTINGERHAYLLTPTAVPEADSYVYMAAGLGVVGWVGRRRKAA